jgi:hypothetical protein
VRDLHHPPGNRVEVLRVVRLHSITPGITSHTGGGALDVVRRTPSVARELFCLVDGFVEGDLEPQTRDRS